jgi:hypothetical protein
MQMICRSSPGRGTGRRHSPIALIFSASRRRASSFHWDRQAGGALVSSVPAYRVAKSRFREVVWTLTDLGLGGRVLCLHFRISSGANHRVDLKTKAKEIRS